jgi:hypothetical protein
VMVQIGVVTADAVYAGATPNTCPVSSVPQLDIVNVRRRTLRLA